MNSNKNVKFIFCFFNLKAPASKTKLSEVTSLMSRGSAFTYCATICSHYSCKKNSLLNFCRNILLDRQTPSYFFWFLFVVLFFRDDLVAISTLFFNIFRLINDVKFKRLFEIDHFSFKQKKS